jgi:hypothetical protein
MRKTLRLRFWLEVGAATITAIMFAITLVWRDWIEVLFRIDPDNGNGSFEWLVVIALLALTMMLLAVARYEWRRAKPATA